MILLLVLALLYALVYAQHTTTSTSTSYYYPQHLHLALSTNNKNNDIIRSLTHKHTPSAATQTVAQLLSSFALVLVLLSQHDLS